MRIRTVRQLEVTSGLTVPAGTEGVLLETISAGIEDAPGDLLVARLGGDVVVQVRRDDIEQAPTPP
jgi:hypothetical protein